MLTCMARFAKLAGVQSANMPSYGINIQSSGAQPIWYGDPDNPKPATIANLSTTSVNIWLGETQSVGPTNPNNSTEITPGGYLSVDGTQPVYYAVADGPNAIAQVLPGVTSFFLPTPSAIEFILYDNTPPSSPILNGVVVSVASAPTTDAVGNDILAGLTFYGYSSSTGYYYALNIQTASPSLSVIGPAVALALYVSPGGEGPWGNPIQTLAFGGVNAANGFIQVFGSLNIDTSSNLVFDGTSSAAEFTQDGNGNVSYQGAGNTWNFGESFGIMGTPAGLPINSTSPITIVSCNVLTGLHYRVRVHIVYVGGATASSAVLGWDGSATISNMIGTVRRARNSTNVDNADVINQNSGLGNLSLAFNAGELCSYEFDGLVTFSAGGTVSVRGQEATAGDTWTVATNSFMSVEVAT